VLFVVIPVVSIVAGNATRSIRDMSRLQVR
jgi:hypothetical protein